MFTDTLSFHCMMTRVQIVTLSHTDGRLSNGRQIVGEDAGIEIGYD